MTTSGKSPSTLPAWDHGRLHVLVDTPAGSAAKFKLDEKKGCYTVSHMLTPGMVFPFDFGSIPSTAAEDGDPLDVLVIAEAPTFPGCLVPVRLIGALEAKQTQEGRTLRNDRLLGVAAESRRYADLHTITDAPGRLLDELEHFFVSYNQARGRKFRILRRVGPAGAKKLVAAAQRRFESK
jgi:inorganic pyrophosphatase